MGRDQRPEQGRRREADNISSFKSASPYPKKATGFRTDFRTFQSHRALSSPLTVLLGVLDISVQG